MSKKTGEKLIHRWGKYDGNNVREIAGNQIEVNQNNKQISFKRHVMDHRKTRYLEKNPDVVTLEMNPGSISGNTK